MSWTSPLVSARQEVRLRVGLRLAELWAAADLDMPNRDLGLVEWEVQAHTPWTVATVSGPDVRRWSQSGHRLFIWLDRTSVKTRIELAGWLDLAPDGNRRKLDLPTLIVHPAKTRQTTLHLLPEPGVELTTANLRGLEPVTVQPPGTPVPGERLYQAHDLSYGGTITVRATGEMPARGTGQLLTSVEIVDRQLQLSSTLVYRLRFGETRTIQVRLRDWEGDKIELKGTGLAAGAIRLAGNGNAGLPGGKDKGDRVWTVELTGSDKPRTLTLRGQVSLVEVRQGTWMPEVAVQGLPVTDTWLAVAGKDLATGNERGLVQEADLTALLAGWRRTGLFDFWAGDAERLRRSGGALCRAPAPAPAACAWSPTSPGWPRTCRCAFSWPSNRQR